MSILNKIQPNKKDSIPENQLNVPELDFLLKVLKTATLTGEQVEMFYNLVVKLQNQYISQQPK